MSQNCLTYVRGPFSQMYDIMGPIWTEILTNCYVYRQFSLLIVAIKAFRFNSLAKNHIYIMFSDGKDIA